MIESELEYLSTLLESVDCGEYLSTFQALDISPDLLVSLDPEAIRELGITKVGDRLRLQVLVKLLMLERIKNEISISSLNESIEGAAESIIKIDEHIKGVESVKNRIITLNVISQDGETHTVEINKEKAAAGLTEARKRILLSVTGILDPSGWKLFYIDYSIGERGVPHEVTDTELNEIIKSAGSQDDQSGLEEHSHRLIVCGNGEMPSIDAINVSNKIHRNKRSKNDVEIKPFMGGRPPSQMISTNLHEFFPGLESKEIADIKRKSKRLSIYSTKMMNDLNTKKRLTFSSSRDSIYSRLSNISKLSDGMSLLSVASYGVAKPLRIDKAVDFEEFNNSPKSYIDAATGNEKEFTAITPCKGSDSSNKSISEGANIVGDDNNSIIELLDESDDDFEGNEEMEMMTVIDNEVTNGPSVWHKGPKIGQGSFGNVYLGLNGLTGELMAIKQVDIPQNESEKSKKMMVTALKQEISLLKDLKHDNIVRYLGSNTDASNMYIFLEYIPGGSVSSMLQMYGAFEEELIRNFTRQVLIGLVYLHSQGIVHRDIKGGNILVDNTGTVKIGDFGISKKIEHEEEETTTSTTKKRSSLQGSVYWMAPEVVKQVAYTAKADIWSVGCLVVEMFTGNHPYPGLSPMQAIFQIGTGRIQPAVPAKAQSSPEAVLFLGRALDPDHISRWTAEDLLQRDAFVQLE